MEQTNQIYLKKILKISPKKGGKNMNSYVFLTETGSTHYCCLEGYAIWLHHYLLYIMKAAAVFFLLFSELLLDRYACIYA